MSGLQEVCARQPEITLPAYDLIASKSLLFSHPSEVLSDQDISISGKRSLLAWWVSDALSVENSPSLRQLASGAVVCVDDIMDALKSLDEPRREGAFTISRSFERRGAKPAARRRNKGQGDDDEPPPPAVCARMPSPWKALIGARRDSIAQLRSQVTRGR